MKITAEIDALLSDNPNGDGYIPTKEGLSENELKELHVINNEYKKLYNTNLIIF